MSMENITLLSNETTLNKASQETRRALTMEGLKRHDMWKARESYFQQEFMVKGLVQGKELAIQNVHTPFSLCEEIIRKLTEFTGFLENKKILVYNIEFLDILYRMGILWNNEVWFVNENNNKVQFAKDIYKGDEDDKFIVQNWLEWSTNMKFDVIVGNPPYQTKSSASVTKTQPIWDKFVAKSLSLLKEDGYLCLVHPSGWREPFGRYSHVKDIILSKTIKYLEMHDEKDGQKMFRCATRYDWYVIKNSPCYNGKLAEINIGNGKNELLKINLKSMPFIPNGEFDIINKILAKNDDEKVEILYSRSAYGSDKSNMSLQENDEFKYPCIYTITNNGNNINFYYSNTNKNGHFGIPKVIFTNGLSFPIVDDIGKYGLLQFAYAVIDQPDNLLFIQKAMITEKFLKVMKACQTQGPHKYSWKVMRYFKKDFWKQFVDVNGNEIK